MYFFLVVVYLKIPKFDDFLWIKKELSFILAAGVLLGILSLSIDIVKSQTDSTVKNKKKNKNKIFTFKIWMKCVFCKCIFGI